MSIYLMGWSLSMVCVGKCVGILIMLESGFGYDGYDMMGVGGWGWSALVVSMLLYGF